MMQKILLIVAIMWLTTDANAEQTIREFQGSGNMTTAEFTVDGPWLLDWRLDGDYPNMVALEVSLEESPSGRYAGPLLYRKSLGNGLRLFNNKGQYRLRISSTLAQWRLKIKTIEPEEVERYSPLEKK